MADPNQKFFDLGLPKWPKMLVTGPKVTVEQAKEIIRRTDTFFQGYDGNNHDYNRQVRECIIMPALSFFEKEGTHQDLCPHRWKKEWGYISTNYVDNSWISCCFIFGAHGWCHPDGTILYGDNVGKWPDVEDIYEDWKALAKSFPFLEADITLWSGEESDEGITPVVSMKVKDGEVTFSETPLHTDPSIGGRWGDEDEVYTAFQERTENGIDDSWIEEWGRLSDELFGEDG